MSDLIVVAYPDMHGASDVLTALQKMQREYLIDLEDACVVTKDTTGKVRLQQAFALTPEGIASGGFWGGLLGLLFLHPLLGIAVGMSAGGVAAMLTDYGINDGFIKELSKKLDRGTSALFVLVRKAAHDKVLAEVGEFGGQILHTSLTAAQEARIEAALRKTPPLWEGKSLSEADLERVLTVPNEESPRTTS